ncbi:MAG: Fpg/Nei family DNA glycosylase [Acidimicrobiales bacterium]
MPEGHTIHRAARLQNKRFKGKPVRSESPQGRFAEGASVVSGAELRKISANGKHLFYEFGSGDVVHVHLGLFGKFRVRSLPTDDPISENCRWLITTETDRLHLAGPTVCELIDPDQMQAIRDRLGPDPLVGRQPSDPVQKIAGRLRRRRTPIGAAILDQKVIAGLGNVYRAEILYLVGLDPFTPANEVDEQTLEALWNESVRQLKMGEKAGRIVTTEPSDVGRSRRRDIGLDERLYCYKRQGERCRRCGAIIRSANIDGRNIWWCPTEQS